MIKIIISKKYGVKEIFIDDEDYQLISKYTWYINKGCSTFYSGNNKVGRMHRYIMNINDSSILIDHINGNGLDNRKENLRICDQKSNVRNSKKRLNTLNNFKGVYFHKNSKRIKKWQASIKVNYKKISLGYFEKEIDAAKAYNRAAKKYFGEFAKVNKI